MLVMVRRAFADALDERAETTKPEGIAKDPLRRQWVFLLCCSRLPTTTP